MERKVIVKDIIDTSITEKYKHIINKSNKRDILIMIKSDILNLCNDISPLELEFLSENIYDYCCLMLHQISEKEIAWYITSKNTDYYNQVSDSDREKFSFNFELKEFQDIIEKYMEILRKE